MIPVSFDDSSKVPPVKKITLTALIVKKASCKPVATNVTIIMASTSVSIYGYPIPRYISGFLILQVPRTYVFKCGDHKGYSKKAENIGTNDDGPIHIA
jgi:hypothetical protein